MNEKFEDKIIDEYFGDDNGRLARVILTFNGFEAEFEKDGVKVERRQLWDHSLHYAGDACENWVMEII